MSYLSIVILAFVLSADAGILSFGYGLSFKDNRMKNSFLLSSATGIFQGVMPVLGYFLTGFVKAYVEPYSDVLVCAIFVFLGLKFIKEAFENKGAKALCLDIKCLLLAGLATSIDAFSAGITLSLCGNTILLPCLIIGIITFAVAFLGFHASKQLQVFPSKYLEIISGTVLIILGISELF